MQREGYYTALVGREGTSSVSFLRADTVLVLLHTMYVCRSLQNRVRILQTSRMAGISTPSGKDAMKFFELS